MKSKLGRIGRHTSVALVWGSRLVRFGSVCEWEIEPEAHCKHVQASSGITTGTMLCKTKSGVPMLHIVPRRNALSPVQAVDEQKAWEWYEQLRDCLPWADLTDTKYQKEGKAIPRRTVFVVEQGCNCTYQYSGVKAR
eukprot:2524958-Amphidinium_carterae.1